MTQLASRPVPGPAAGRRGPARVRTLWLLAARLLPAANPVVGVAGLSTPQSVLLYGVLALALMVGMRLALSARES